MSDSPAVLWFRRDLRLADHPALLAAAGALDGGGAASRPVLPLFVVDPALWATSGERRRARLAASLRALDAELGGALVVAHGDPTSVVPAVAREAGAGEVHVTADFGPYGARRDDDVERALVADGRALARTGSPYAVAPGTVVKDDGTPYKVFTPFHHAWLAHGWSAPAPGLEAPTWTTIDAALVPGHDDARTLLDEAATDTDAAVVGEAVALDRWQLFRDELVDDYAIARDRPDLGRTSQLSVALRWGEIHPRTMLADLGDTKGQASFARQLCWREFYADVLAAAPASARESLYPGAEVDADSGPEADARFDAWCAGRTGYPYVDAGMRQLLATGWMHNRLRLVTASFLVKDLHLPWQRGARFFMRHLEDGDLANNQHGWQWTAGTGTDAAPYVRVFNPVTQGLRFDPDGDFVRQWVPELRAIEGAAVHEPWKHNASLFGAGADDYTERIVDHAEERTEALRRWECRAD